MGECRDSERGGTGRRAGFRSRSRKGWEFESPRSHHDLFTCFWKNAHRFSGRCAIRLRGSSRRMMPDRLRRGELIGSYGGRLSVRLTRLRPRRALHHDLHEPWSLALDCLTCAAKSMTVVEALSASVAVRDAKTHRTDPLVVGPLKRRNDEPICRTGASG